MRAWRVRIVPSSSPATKPPTELAQPLALPDKPSIAVLPFENMSDDVEQEYFADGMVEDIITGLSRSKSLFVIARNSSFTYKGKAVDIKRVGREPGVRYVLEGSVRKAGNRVRITAQLVDAATGNHIWADRYDSTLEDIFDLQDRVTTLFTDVFGPRLLLCTIHQYERYRRNRAST
jgi:adenylate cyclase